MSKKFPFKFRWYHIAIIMMLLPISFSVERFVFMPAKSVQLLFQHHNWVPVSATVANVGVGSGMPLCGGQRPKVIYFFDLDGRIYKGDRVYLQDCFPMSRPQKLEILQYYQTHKNITVYANPDNPNESVIIKDPYYNVLANFLIYLMIFAAALIFRGLWLVLDQPNKKRGFQYTDYLPVNKQVILNTSGSTSKNVAKTAIFIFIMYFALLPRWAFDPSQGLFYALWAIEIGVILYWVWLYFHPKCSIQLPQKKLYRDKPFVIKIDFSGKISNLESFDVKLTCEEQYYEARDVGQFTRKYIPLRRYVLCSKNIKRFQTPNIYQSNSLEISIPKDAAPSMQFGQSSIKWLLQVSSNTKKNIRYNSEFEIAIWPKELQEYES